MKETKISLPSPSKLKKKTLKMYYGKPNETILHRQPNLHGPTVLPNAFGKEEP
jgi:hypothetical protein